MPPTAQPDQQRFCQSAETTHQATTQAYKQTGRQEEAETGRKSVDQQSNQQVSYTTYTGRTASRTRFGKATTTSSPGLPSWGRAWATFGLERRR